jgi:hypothetical protein
MGLADGGLHSAQFGAHGLTPEQQPILGPAAPWSGGARGTQKGRSDLTATS